MSTISFSDSQTLKERRRTRTRAQVRDALVAAIILSGRTRSDIAKALGVGKSKVSRDLSSLTNFTLDSLSDYATALDLHFAATFGTPRDTADIRLIVDESPIHIGNVFVSSPEAITESIASDDAASSSPTSEIHARVKS